MAIIFELWAECLDQPTAQAFVQHFSHLHFTLLTGRVIQWQTSLEQHSTAGTSISGSSADLSSYGVRSLQDALEATEVGLRLYHHLKSAPAFRFARIDWEAGNIPLRDLPEFVETWASGERQLSLECVVDDELYQDLGAPQHFVPFRPGYWWRTYSGEIYRPLHSNEQKVLNQLCLQLFPDYFAL
jgi:hypothetical protein